MTRAAPSGFNEDPQAAFSAVEPIHRREGTRAADGFDRVAWTVDDIRAFAAVGLFNDDTKIELIEGELLPMPPHSGDHETIKNDMGAIFIRALPTSYRVAFESSLLLNERNWYDPDIMIYDKRLPAGGLYGPDPELVIEVSHSTLSRDKKLKSPVYARCGVRELWIIDTEARIIHVHRGPSAEGWGETFDVPADQAIAPLAFPEVSICLDARSRS